MKKMDNEHMSEDDKNPNVSNQSSEDSVDSTSDLMLEEDWDEETPATGSLGGERELYDEDEDYLVSSTSPQNKEEVEEEEIEEDSSTI